jgi:peptide/nickel transport system ATP-binding protein
VSAALLELDKLVKHYALPRESLWAARRQVTALAGVSLSVLPGRSLGLVGESGSGKSTLARIAIALEPPSSGVVRFEGQDVASFSGEGRRRIRRDVQMVFQDPYGSLDPRRTVGWIVAEPLWTQSLGRARREAAVAEVLASVGLRPADAAKYPHEFSGGQRQRIAIARALITKPRLIIADEPVSALDVSVQAQVLNLLEDLQRDFGVTFLLISHDLAVVDHVCDRVAVMYRGRIVEEGSPRALFQAPAHPYTRALIAAMPKPIPGRRRDLLKGSNGSGASPSGMPKGCPYADRCPQARERCHAEAPPLREVGAARRAACHFAEEVMALPAPA